MDYEFILSKYRKTLRYRLLRNTVIITALILAGIFTALYLTQQQENFLKKSNRSGILIKADSSKLKADSIPRNLISITSDSFVNVNQMEKEISHALPDQEKKPGESFKIKETMPAEQQYIPASPVNGFDSLYQYFNEKLKYPENLMAEKITGKVVLRFSIGKDGKVGEVTVIQNLNPKLDSIASEAVKNMPPWTPARANGVTIETIHSIPLIFSIDSLQKQ